MAADDVAFLLHIIDAAIQYAAKIFVFVTFVHFTLKFW